MSFFACLIDPRGAGVSPEVLQRCESLARSCQLTFSWQTINQITVLVAGDTHGASMVACEGDYVAVGTVRLDNRAELERLVKCEGRALADLDLVLLTVAQYGTKYVSRILGDFGFLVWNCVTRTGIAAVDAFAVKKLYYTARDGLLAFASRGEALATEERYEVQYLAELLAACPPSPGLSVYAGVMSVQAGSTVFLEGYKCTAHRYWSAYDFEMEPRWTGSEHEAAEICRALLIDAVVLRLSGADDTWSQLSGGLDSSSIVSVAQWLYEQGMVQHGLAGSITFVDSHGTGADEREYSNAVRDRWRLRNELIVDPPLWHDGQSPPRTDDPRTPIAMYPRDQRLCHLVRRGGGRVMLTGVGGDCLFAGNMLFFADWLIHGQAWQALGEMARRAAIGRVSFWDLAYRNALLPLLPPAVVNRLMRDVGQTPPWIQRATARRYQLEARAFGPLGYAGRVRHKYDHAVAVEVAAIGDSLAVGVIEDALDVRHPYLYRPLVEFARRLPPDFCARPHARKWVLREAMRDILPEVVRTRVGKGVTTGLFAWSTATQQKLLEPLIQDPILADLGVIDRSELHRWFVAAQHERNNRQRLSSTVQFTLAVEAWLQVRSGRWPRGPTTLSRN